MMRYILILVLIFAAYALPAEAVTYSWIDGQDTSHFTEDLSQVPKKYRKKMNRRADVTPSLPVIPAASPVEGAVAKKPVIMPQKETPGTAAPVPANAQQRFGGKTEEEWRKEFAAQEGELTVLEQQMTRVSERVKSVKGRLSNSELESLKQEQKEAAAAYQQKYKTYSDLIESARKAGLTVNMRK